MMLRREEVNFNGMMISGESFVVHKPSRSRGLLTLVTVGRQELGDETVRESK